MMKARALTESDGRWPALRAELVALNPGGAAVEYLVALGRKQAGARTA